MIRTFEVEHYKSIVRLKLALGRVNVLIGENGSGKSNILEAIALAGAAAADRLSYEFMAPRGIRVAEPALMVPAFEGEAAQEIRLAYGVGEEPDTRIQLPPDLTPKGPWLWSSRPDGDPTVHQRLALIEAIEAAESDVERHQLARRLRALATERVSRPFDPAMAGFLVYSPEYSTLRVFHDETQILPLGVQGQGLFAHLKALSKEQPELLRTISDQLDLIGWFDGFTLPDDLAPGERTLRIRDRYLIDGRLFDQRSANEGFLFLLFYVTLLVSPQTPPIFAIDNIDASLNPKLCSALVRRMVTLAKAHDKQLLLTTHNPAVLDGLDLTDDEQRLFVVSRGSGGATRVRRIQAPKPLGDDPPVRLSEAFLKGYLGGLPNNF
ncbi:MAG: AAA family ATPase [Alphaproteobacteria bacterium]|nr:AAA family ATPase [Alphaproteobacteria bacterium]